MGYRTGNVNWRKTTPIYCEWTDGALEDVEAPRAECGCRACYRAREVLIPEELRKFIGEQCDHTKAPFKMPSLSINIVRQILSAYCVGRVSLEEAWVEIIKQLVGQNDKLYATIAKAEMLSPKPMFLTKRIPEREG
jgi:hypothetical protein